MHNDMRKFIAALFNTSACVILVILLMLISGIFIIGCQYEDGYDASLIDKLERLKSINEPKIILIGNSNVSLGMNSKMLENAIKMPVVNLGLHGVLGNAFHEDIAKCNINSGDLIIVCHSTYSDDNRINDVGRCWITLEYHKELWEILRPEDYPDMLIGFPRYWLKSLLTLIKRTINIIEDVPYGRASLNMYGDVAIKPEKYRKSPEKLFQPRVDNEKVQKVPEINDICVNRLNQFNKYAKDRGAVLLIAGYPIAYGKYTHPVEEYVKFQEELVKKLKCDVISDFRDYFIPYEYFYDSYLHLDERGAKIRTLQLIKDIKRWLADKNKQ